MLDLTSLEKALSSLRSSLKVALSDDYMKTLTMEARDAIRAGVIRNFEFTYELCWKFMKRRLSADLGSSYIDGLNRKELFRIACEHHLISDVEPWMGYHEKRNETAHTYDKATAEEVFGSAAAFLKDAEAFYSGLKKKNA
jgi:nucleotidyltransferase substrate binding protein (TIGR01987 family)